MALAPARVALKTCLAATLACVTVLAGCGEVVLTDGATLSRSDRFVQTKETTSDARLYSNRLVLERARTVRIIPTRFGAETQGAAILTPEERRLAANAADRAMCYELSLRYDVVSTPDADLTVRSRVTRVDPTDLVGAGASIGVSAAVTIAGAAGVAAASTFGPIPTPRLPLGLGSLTVEAEALDRHNHQQAAMVWGGAANSFTSLPRYSPISDAYDLAGDFGQDFGFYVATGKDPFKSPLFIPNWDRIRVTGLGEAPLDPDCEAFGRAPGIDGSVFDYIGLPPDYADKGPAIR